MRLTKFILCILVHFEFGLTSLLAQNNLVVKEAGNQTSYTLKSIRNLTFSSGNAMKTRVIAIRLAFSMMIFTYIPVWIKAEIHQPELQDPLTKILPAVDGKLNDEAWKW